MSEGVDSATRPTDKVGRVLYGLAEWLALLGGVVVGAIALLISLNVVGRAAFTASISGIVDLIELGTSTAIFAFLPYCQIIRGNVFVDFFMTRAPTRVKTFCDIIGNLMYLVLGTLLTWRLILGGFDMYKYNESFTTLGFPRWISFPYAAVCMTLLIAVTIYTTSRSIAETRAGRFFDPSLDRSKSSSRTAD